MNGSLWVREDPLQQYHRQVNLEALAAFRSQKKLKLQNRHWEPVQSLFEKLIAPDPAVISTQLSSECIQIGCEGEISDSQHSILVELIEKLIPWRKGPFSLFGTMIDAEWRSDQKWDRIAEHLGDMSNQIVLDIGCNNGYYMMRLLEKNPHLVYGIDPSERTFYQFELMQRYLQEPRLFYDLLGVGQLHMFSDFFDAALCMGILYHHRNPYQLLLDIRDSLKPGGTLLMENIVLPGDEPTALVVPDRYAMMRNVYFIPTTAALVVWLERAGFMDVKVLDVTKVTPQEQRKTKYAPFQSLEDFLDPNDANKTVEGFPAPYRACILAKRKEEGR